jgi:RimJ/RimL family protein N-acetyltransferase
LSCEVGNEKSIGVAKHLGFEDEGTCRKGFIVNGVFQTVMLWGMQREDWKLS